MPSTRVRPPLASRLCTRVCGSAQIVGGDTRIGYPLTGIWSPGEPRQRERVPNGPLGACILTPSPGLILRLMLAYSLIVALTEIVLVTHTFTHASVVTPW